MRSDDAYEFDLVPTSSDATISSEQWTAIRSRLLELQPARSVSLVGAPPTAIHVVALGSVVDVAPGLLHDIERLAGTSLRVVFDRTRS